MEKPEIQHLAAQPGGTRVETGPVQFGDDWPGVFIRGDMAMWLAFQLREEQLRSPPPAEHTAESIGYPITRLAELLESCRVR